MINTEVEQPSNGIITHLIFLNTNNKVKIINTKTPNPNNNITFDKAHISSAIIGTPPK